MKYTISDENRWTTLAACVEHHVFYGYAPDVFFDCFRNLDIEPSPLNIKGLYPEQQLVNNFVKVTIKPDYKHISPEKWNGIVNELHDDLDVRQAQDEIIKAMKEARRAYFGDAKEKEQELYRRIRRSLADSYNDGYHYSKYQLKPGYGAVQGKFDWILDAVMDYMRAVLNNKESKL